MQGRISRAFSDTVKRCIKPYDLIASSMNHGDEWKGEQSSKTKTLVSKGSNILFLFLAIIDFQCLLEIVSKNLKVFKPQKNKMACTLLLKSQHGTKNKLSE